MHTVFRWSALALLAVSTLIVATTASAAPKTDSPACAQVRAFGNTSTLLGCNFSDDAVDPVTRALEFVAANKGSFKNPQLTPDLKLIESVPGLASEHIRFQQMLQGYPIADGLVTVHLDAKGHVRRAHNTFDVTISNAVAGNMKYDQSAALDVARQALADLAGGPLTNLTLQSARQVWYPRNAGVLVLAWELKVTADKPLYDYRFIIDRATGKILLQQNQLQHWAIGYGSHAFQPNPIQTSGDVTLNDNSDANLINSLQSYVNLPGLLENSGLLKGRFVDVTFTSPFAPQNGYPIANEPSRVYRYDVVDPRFGQVNAYFGVDSAQRFLRSLGFAGERTVPNGIHEQPVKVYAHWNSDDNSFYRPSDDTLRFGDGGVPDVEDNDIVVHEYGHAIQHVQNASLGVCTQFDPPYRFGDCEMRAMGEGFSDYYAAVVHLREGNAAYQDANAACVGEWDSTAYRTQIGSAPTCLRRVDSSNMYPADPNDPNDVNALSGEIHEDGKIWSRALWDLSKSVGIYVATQIVIEHQFSLPQDATMPQAALEMLAVDDSLFMGFHQVALRQAFCARGILQGTDCTVPQPQTFTVYASKDTLIRQSSPNRNEGQSPLLRLKGDLNVNSRILVGFDLSGVNLANVKSVALEMSIAGTDANWDIFGRTIDAYPLALDFPEGNGVYIGAEPGNMVLGSGGGVTWACRNDTDINNYTTECDPADSWVGGAPANDPLPAGTNKPPVVQTGWQTSGRVRWNVTSDIANGISRWIVKKTFDDKPGRVDFYSKEGALALDPYDLAGLRPRLVFTLQ